jgi:uncharacterized membrane protein
MHNIGLYIYTVKYKSSIKIPDFLQNISKKNKKIIQNIFKKTKYFVAYGQFLKFSQSYFSLKKIACF